MTDPVLSSERTSHDDTHRKNETSDLKSGHESPKNELDTKTDRPTDHQLQSDLELHREVPVSRSHVFWVRRHGDDAAGMRAPLPRFVT
jgi:hypothetical protein